MVGVLAMVVVLHEFKPCSQDSTLYIQHITHIKLSEEVHPHKVKRPVSKIYEIEFTFSSLVNYTLPSDPVPMTTKLTIWQGVCYRVPMIQGATI